MKRHYKFALALHSMIPCIGADPGCTMSAFATQTQSESCPLHHRHHHESPTGHECCQTATCPRGANLTANSRAESTRHFARLLCVASRLRRADLRGVAPIDTARRGAHPRPRGIPIFLSIRTFLI